MTTLLISEIFPPVVGGSGRWLWELYRRLPRDEYLLAVGRHPRQAAFDRTHDLRLARVPLSFPELGICYPRGLAGYLRALGPIRTIARRAGVRRVHAGRCLPEGWIALLLRWRYGLPYLCYVHGEEVKLVAESAGGGRMASRQYRLMSGAALRGAERLIANSYSTARILREEWGLPPDRIRVLHPGVDTRRFAGAARSAAVRARLGWGDRPVVLTVARLEPHKGHDAMLRALAEVRRSAPDVLYVIVGDGSERAAIERLVAELRLGGHVQLLPGVGDEALIECYQQCDLFVLPNRQVGRDIEGFGIVLLEAQACGKPVLAGASGGTAEAMRAPETGRLLAFDDPGRVAAEVGALLGDREQLRRMGAAARRWAVEEFDWNVVMPRAAEALTPLGDR